MSTINREAAIRNLTAIISKQEGKPLIHWEQVKKMLEAMPDVPDTNAGDTISRQAAIDAVRRSEALVRAFGYGHAVDALRELPSAQPERKTGKWIRNDNGTYSCSVCQSWIPEEQHCYAQYCLYCGSDMRGDQ